MRPRGKPPPNARSSEILPDGIHSTLAWVDSPNFIMEPLPNCFSIDSIARLNALALPSLAATPAAACLSDVPLSVAIYPNLPKFIVSSPPNRYLYYTQCLEVAYSILNTLLLFGDCC